MKKNLDAITEDADEYNRKFLAIHQEARVGTGSAGSNSYWGTNTRPDVQAAGLRVNHTSAGKVVAIYGQEYRELSTYGLAEDVTSAVKDLQNAELGEPVYYRGA